VLRLIKGNVTGLAGNSKNASLSNQDYKLPWEAFHDHFMIYRFGLLFHTALIRFSFTRRVWGS
jgi:hypothetical protein